MKEKFFRKMREYLTVPMEPPRCVPETEIFACDLQLRMKGSTLTISTDNVILFTYPNVVYYRVLRTQVLLIQHDGLLSKVRLGRYDPLYGFTTLGKNLSPMVVGYVPAPMIEIRKLTFWGEPNLLFLGQDQYLYRYYFRSGSLKRLYRPQSRKFRRTDHQIEKIFY